ncbi:uroporphyrinogen decarboxylase [Fictibacillus macauensis ZFHKF-1]|uniref:Uroporphyrinogen decarboxylase n=1 Tax=Fictibacillus macauensis ZFHKF-1 TaxID=1196324 RepID=I8AJ70_9BACL|nr:uroporphyrinogen decarboxylase [Fictibacillus macauensis ZFHKF-1]
MTWNEEFLKACRKENNRFVPVWYMRQAGRSQPEYRKLKEKYSLFEITHQPELCAQVTKLPVDQHGVDAAILYKDIMSPVPSLGVNVEIKAGVGPVIDQPIRTLEAVERLGMIQPEKDVSYVLDTIKLLRKQLDVPLITFAGAPFTIASYLIEGGPSREYHETKALMYSNPTAWFMLMDKLKDMTIAYAKAQIASGAQAFQIFDSWVGALNVDDFRTYIKPTMHDIFSELQHEGVPLILYGTGARHLLNDWNELPIDVIGLDWRTSPREAREMGITKALQGNLDPSILLAPWEVIERKATQLLDEGMEEAGFIFNVGKGIFPEVKVETLQRLTAFIHEYSSKKMG